MTREQRVAEAICRERCACMGEPPCYAIKGVKSPACDCDAIAKAALAEADKDQQEVIRQMEGALDCVYVISSSGDALPSAVITPSKKDALAIGELIRKLGQIPNIRKDSLKAISMHYQEDVDGVGKELALIGEK